MMGNYNRHDCFIGRWVIFHNGHLAIIKKVYDKNKRQILILVMDTDEIPCAKERKTNIEKILLNEQIPCNVMIIPPISSINWGRNVGYERNYIEIDPETQKISGTDIRDKIKKNSDQWREMIPQGC